MNAAPRDDAPMIYLASQSARRKTLLAQAGVTFTPLSLDAGVVVETPRPREKPVDYVTRMACAKAVMGLRHARRAQLPPLPVLGADTEVVLNHRIFGKPANAAHAGQMIAALSGNTHDVISAVAMAAVNPQAKAKHARYILLYHRVVTTQVTMKKLTKDEIADYLASHEWEDKAGGYAIQGRAGAFVTHLSGSFFGVVGLPLYEALSLLYRYEAHVG